MRTQQKMGMVFLAVTSFFALFLSSLSFAGQILLPANPRPAKPPSRGEVGAEEDFRRKKQHLDQQLDRQTADPPSPSEKRDEALLKESITPTPLTYGATLSLLYSFVRTSGDEREDYTADPSVHLGVFYRPIKSSDSSNLNLWLGARAYFVGGTGTYEGTSGRYSFTYFGPMVGVGKFDPGPESVGVEKPAASNGGVMSRDAYFLLAGVAGQSRLATHEVTDEEPKDDLNNQTLAFDSPGVWAEVWYANLRYNAISLQSLAGVQTGKQKYFFYIGVGVGGWR